MRRFEKKDIKTIQKKTELNCGYKIEFAGYNEYEYLCICCPSQILWRLKKFK